MSGSVVEELAHKRLGRTIKGKWRLDRLIGVGGMAAVYAATHRNGARVAIKMLHSTVSTSQQLRSRFVREGYLANKVDHPGVVRVLDDDVDETDQSAFLVMDLVIGATLADRATERLLDAGELLDVAEQVLQVLQAAHEKGIIHRDLKPDNLLVDKEGKVHVLDFGIARLLDEAGSATATKTGTAFGTPGFMAPEQAMGKTALITARTDLYALGATLFALACGDFVHAAENPQELMVLVATQPARSLGALAPTLHPEVVALVDKTTQNAPEERWESAAAMLSAVCALREKLGLRGARVLPIDLAPFQPPPTSARTPPPLSRTPAAEPAVASALGQSQSPSAPVSERPRGSAPHLDPMTLTADDASPFEASTPEPAPARRPRLLPMAIIGGAAALLGIVALVVTVTGRGGGADKSGTATPPLIAASSMATESATTIPSTASASGSTNAASASGSTNAANASGPTNTASASGSTNTATPPVASASAAGGAAAPASASPTAAVGNPSAKAPAPKSPKTSTTSKGIDLGY